MLFYRRKQPRSFPCAGPSMAAVTANRAQACKEGSADSAAQGATEPGQSAPAATYAAVARAGAPASCPRQARAAGQAGAARGLLPERPPVCQVCSSEGGLCGGVCECRGTVDGCSRCFRAQALVSEWAHAPDVFIQRIAFCDLGPFTEVDHCSDASFSHAGRNCRRQGWHNDSSQRVLSTLHRSEAWACCAQAARCTQSQADGREEAPDPCCCPSCSSSRCASPCACLFNINVAELRARYGVHKSYACPCSQYGHGSLDHGIVLLHWCAHHSTLSIAARRMQVSSCTIGSLCSTRYGTTH